MRPRGPRGRVIVVNGHMQHRDLSRETTLSGHDINVTTEEARNASKGRISKDLAHHTVVRLGRSRTVDTVGALASQCDMLVAKGGAASPASWQRCNKTAQLGQANGKQPRRLFPRGATTTLVKVYTFCTP